MKNKKIILSLLLIFVMVFVIGFGFSVKANVNKVYADVSFSVDFKSISNEYSDYNNVTINTQTPFTDIVSAIKNANSNISSDDIITFYFCACEDDFCYEYIYEDDYINGLYDNVYNVYYYRGLSQEDFGNYYFGYKVGRDVEFNSISNDYSNYELTITENTTFSDIADVIKNADSNITSQNTIIFYLYQSGSDNSLETIDEENYDENVLSVIKEFEYDPENYEDYYFTYEVGTAATLIKYSYDSSNDGLEMLDDGTLKVKFTVSNMNGFDENLSNWAVYFIEDVSYNEKHLISETYRNDADYYFLVNPTTAEVSVDNGKYHYTLYVDSDAVAYYARTENPSDANDLGIRLVKTMYSALLEENWKVGIGPICEYDDEMYSQIEYYVGSKEDDLSLATANNISYEEGKIIEFTVALDETSLVFNGPSAVENKQEVTVTYTVTTNSGINSLILIPEYDAKVFTLTNVTVNNGTVLGESEVTYNYATHQGLLKILFENAGEDTTYEETNEILLTLTFETRTDITSDDNGEYTFGLLTNYTDTPGSKSIAYEFLDGEQLGEQKEVKVSVVTAAVTVIVKKAGSVEIVGKSITYNGSSSSAQVVVFAENVGNKFTYQFEGDGEITYQFYSDANCTTPYQGNYVIGQAYLKVTLSAGTYYTGDSDVSQVVINRKHVNVKIHSKSSAYGDPTVPLTWNLVSSSTLCEGDTLDDLNVSLTIATVPLNVGQYHIGGYSNSSKYEVGFQSAYYTITPKAITITALDQDAPYTGSEPVVNQTKYTVTGVTSISGVVITKAAGVNVGEYTLTPSLNNSNYNVTAQTGVFTITSVGKTADYLKSFYSGDTVTYDAQQHNLLIVDSGKPTWFTHTASNNEQTNVNRNNNQEVVSYTITVTITVTEQNAKNYIDAELTGDQEYVATVYGTINPYAMTVTAENKTSAYGTTPATLTPTTTGLNGEVNVTFTVKNNETPITLTSTTPVGTYTIVPSATSTNYNFTFVNGTYTVTKGQASITSVTPQDVYYNRALNYVVSGLSIPGIANPVEGTDYTVTVTLDTTQEHGDVVNDVRPYGTYTITVTVAGTTNYDGATKSATFHINQIALKAPTNVTYTAYNSVTWNAITTDEGDVALVEGTTVIYSRGVNNQYTPTDSGMFTVHFGTLNNNNYTSATLELKPIIEVTFIDDHSDHAKDDIDPEDMPSSMYMFVGANVPGIVLPDTAPTLPGYTFNAWSLDSEEEIGEDIYDSTLTRVYKTTWTIKTLTMTLKFTETSSTLGEDMFTVNVEYKEAIAWTNIPQPAKASTDPGITYVYNNTVKVSGTETTYTGTYNTSSLALQGIVATENTTFIALYNETYNSFTIKYYVSVDGADYGEVSDYEDSATYGDTIDYASLPNIIWFRADSWYTNTDRTIVAPATMPAHNIDVYGAYVFDIGTGDINGDGYVNANDITLYRQWIVGGYEMTDLTTNEDIFDAVNAELETPTETKYFIYRVADINGDSSKDIRDVSITRMAIVGGYTWDNENGYNVTGNEIIRNVNTNTFNSIDSAIRAGKKVTLTDDVTEAEGIINISTTKHVNIDLGGHTLTLKSFSVVSTRRTNITITNGTIITEEGITIASPYGNVVITDVTGYDADGIVNLAAANHSLHLNGVVAFRHGDTTESVPAQVNVEKDTHIVVEPEAEVIVEKIIVTEDFAPAVAETAIITIDNFSVVTEEIVVEGNVTMNDNEIDTLEELIEIATKGGNYVLAEDLTYTGQVGFTVSTTIDLNGHTLRSTNDVALVAVNGATLTIKGNGNVMAQEACVMAFDASEVVINGGTYTAVDNFIFGTNGTRNRGKNTLTINNGTFNGGIVTNGYVACGVYVANDDLVNINGGTFNITNGVGVLARSGNTTIGEDVVFNVTGNGTLGKVGDAKVTVPAGEVIVLDRAAGYPGGLPTLTNLTEYNVYINGVIANVNDLVYAAQNGGVYTVTADVTYTGQVGFTKDTTIKLNNHTLRSTNNVALSALNGATLTINGNGNVIAQEACVMAFDASEVVINGGTYTAIDNFVFGTNGTNGRGNNTLTINNGTFNGGIVSNGYVACGVYVANNDLVYINGGTFNITNGVGVLARSGNTRIGEEVVFNVTGNGTLGKVGDAKVTVPAGEVIVLDKAAGYPGGLPTISNESSYSIFVNGTIANTTDLVYAIAHRGAYTLTGDVVYNGQAAFTQDTVINLNNHTLRSANDVALSALNGATLTINGNGNVMAQEACVMAFDASTVIINGGTYTSVDNFVIGTNGTNGRGGNTIIINAGTFNGGIVTNGYVACGVYVANNDTVTINGGTFNITNGVGVLARSGNTTIGANVTMNVTGNSTLGKVGDSRVVIPSGEELVIDYLANYPGGNPTLTNNSSYSVHTISND